MAWVKAVQGDSPGWSNPATGQFIPLPPMRFDGTDPADPWGVPPDQPQASQPAALLSSKDIQSGTGFALNPATGKYEQAYAKQGVGDNGMAGNQYDYSFDPAGRQSLAGWAPGYYTDNGGGGLSDILKKLATPQNLFFAGTTGQGGMTLANAATGGDVGKGVLTDAAGLAAGAGLAQALPTLGLSTPAAALATEAGAAGATAPAALGTEAANVAGGLKVAPEAATLESAISGASTAGGASGITPIAEGANAAIGGGATGTGLTGTLANSALAPGAFASETLPLALLGTGAAGAAGAGLAGSAAAGGSAASTAIPAAAAGAAGTAAAAGAGGVGATKLSDVLSGNVNPLDNLTLGNLGTIGATAGSVLGQQNIADKYDALARDYMGLGAPSRQRYEASFDPNFDISKLPGLQQSMDTSYQSLLRSLSTNGNPFGSPGGLTEAMKYVTGNVALPALNQYRNQNASTGGFGAFSTAAPGAAGDSIGAQGGVYSDIGKGLGNMLNPPTSLETLLKQMKGTGIGMSLA